jgi:glutathione S-transferase
MAESVRLYVAAPASVSVIQCSPPSWMAQIVLAEKSVAGEVIELDFGRGDHKTPELLTKNPRGTIPILCHGERVIHETLAVLEYLESAFPQPPLMPRDLDGLARGLSRLHESAALKDAGMALFAYLMRTPVAVRDAARLADLVGALRRELDCWERHYTGVEWAVGSSLTLPDVVVFTYLATAHQLGLDLARRWPALQAFSERMSTRASVRSTLSSTWQTRREDLAGFG